MKMNAINISNEFNAHQKNTDYQADLMEFTGGNSTMKHFQMNENGEAPGQSMLVTGRSPPHNNSNIPLILINEPDLEGEDKPKEAPASQDVNNT